MANKQTAEISGLYIAHFVIEGMKALQNSLAVFLLEKLCQNLLFLFRLLFFLMLAYNL